MQMSMSNEDVTKQARVKKFKVPIRPVTRARAKLFKEELHNLIIKIQRGEMDAFANEAIQENHQPRLVHVIRAGIEESPH